MEPKISNDVNQEVSGKSDFAGLDLIKVSALKQNAVKTEPVKEMSSTMTQDKSTQTALNNATQTQSVESVQQVQNAQPTEAAQTAQTAQAAQTTNEPTLQNGQTLSQWTGNIEQSIQVLTQMLAQQNAGNTAQPGQVNQAQPNIQNNSGVQGNANVPERSPYAQLSDETFSGVFQTPENFNNFINGVMQKNDDYVNQVIESRIQQLIPVISQVSSQAAVVQGKSAAIIERSPELVQYADVFGQAINHFIGTNPNMPIDTAMNLAETYVRNTYNIPQSVQPVQPARAAQPVQPTRVAQPVPQFPSSQVPIGSTTPGAALPHEGSSINRDAIIQELRAANSPY